MDLERDWKSLVIKDISCQERQEYVTKEESSSPIVSLYALMGSCVMDVLDDRKVITVDISRAFLQKN